jgi:hypothetical protein
MIQPWWDRIDWYVDPHGRLSAHEETAIHTNEARISAKRLKLARFC